METNTQHHHPPPQFQTKEMNQHKKMFYKKFNENSWLKAMLKSCRPLLTPLIKTLGPVQNLNKDIPTNTPKQNDTYITGYRFVDVEILTDLIKMLCCPECNENRLLLHENFHKKKGFVSLMFIKCVKCDFCLEFCNSKSADQGYDINRRIIYAMR